MRTIRLMSALLAAVALAACGGPKVIGGDSETVSIEAGPLSDADAAATDYCRRYGKSAVLLGDGPLGPSTVERLYDYNCVSPAAQSAP